MCFMRSAFELLVPLAVVVAVSSGPGCSSSSGNGSGGGNNTGGNNTTGNNQNPSVGSTGVQSFKTQQLPAPTLGVTGNLLALGGVIRVKLPGSNVFVYVTLRQVPFGSVIDASHGRVQLTTVGPHGKLQTIDFYGGYFSITQSRKSGVVIARLWGGNFSVCPKVTRNSAFAAAKSKKHVVRKLWAEGHGSYTTKGSYATGAVLGTRWLTEDRCDGTLIYVATDKVLVTNTRTHRHFTIRAGHSYLALR